MELVHNTNILWLKKVFPSYCSMFIMTPFLPAPLSQMGLLPQKAKTDTMNGSSQLLSEAELAEVALRKLTRPGHLTDSILHLWHSELKVMIINNAIIQKMEK